MRAEVMLKPELVIEFLKLKRELFGKEMFVVLNESDPKVQRYNQLLGYCHSGFRYDGWVNPEQ